MAQAETSSLRLEGERKTGQDVRTENVTAAMAVANVVRTSLGPMGLDKMLVDEIGDVTVSNDGAKILEQLEVEHPAAKVLVDLARLQDEEVGDGTTTVVLVAAELLKRGNELVKKNIHPTNVIAGFRLAMKEAVKYIREVLAVSTVDLGREIVVASAKTSMSSKVIGTEMDFFAQMIVNAMETVRTKNSKGQSKYPVKAVNILKQHGRSVRESVYVPGFALNCTRAAQGMPVYIKDAKIAMLDFDLQKGKMKMGVQILVNDPKELEAIRQKEVEITKNRIQMILDCGANVVLTTRGIDDLNLKYFVESGVMAVRRVKKDDMRRIARLTGGSICVTLATLEGEEGFDTSLLGHADEVVEQRLADDELIFINAPKAQHASSIVLRGPNEYMLDEMERSVHDSLCAVKRTLESKSIVPGGGAVEAALSVHLENFAMTLESKEQMAIGEFAEALLVVPKQLAVNAAKDSTDLVARLRAHHHISQTDESRAHLKNMGFDLMNGAVRDNFKAGVVEPVISKVKSLQFATEAAISIMRIDDFVRLNPKQPQGPPQ